MLSFFAFCQKKKKEKKKGWKEIRFLISSLPLSTFSLRISILKMRPPSHILRSLAEAQSKVFSTTPPPPVGQDSLRTGAKYLRKRLVGPSMLRYYPPVLNLRSFRNMFPELKEVDEETGKMRSLLMDPEEHQRLLDVEKKKANGKGPPKKGK